jgi:hypothetical protein
MQRPRHRIACWTVAVALLASGCNSESNAPPPLPAAAEMRPADPVAAESKPAADRGNTDYSGASEPPAKPASDVPLYGQALLISSMSSPKRGTIVNLRTEDAPERVAAWYGTELPARGWELEKQSGVAGTYLVTARKAGNKATVLITSGAPATQILITVLEDR